MESAVQLTYLEGASMRQNLIRAVVAVSLLLTLAPTSVNSFREEASPLAEAVRFRELLGFTTNLQAVSALEQDAAAHFERHPIALTEAEATELDRRLFVQENLDGILNWGREHPAIWGGAWVDHKLDGALVVQLTEDLAQYRAEIASLAPAEARLHFTTVNHTSATLTTSLEQISADLPDLSANGIHITDVILRPSENVLLVMVDGLTEAVTRYLTDRYGGDGVLRVVGSDASGATGCVSRSNCPGPPLRAGIGASSPSCSLSFVSYKASNPSQYHLLTAGHCGSNGGTWKHNGVPIGTMSADSTYNGSTADAALIGPITANQISRWTYKRYHTVYVMTSRDSAFDDIEGDLVCLAAKQDEYVRCGAIQGFGTHQIEPGVYVSNQRYANYAWQGGDSGGAVLYGSRAIGIQSGYAGTWATYSHIHYAQSRTGSWVNVSNCGNYC